MIRREVRPRRPGTFEGIFLILGIVAGLWLVSFGAEVARVLSSFRYAPVAVWLVGGGAAALVMRHYLRGFIFSLSDEELLVERTYGSGSGKVILRIPRGDIIEVGEKKDVLTDDRRINENAVCTRNKAPVKVLAYRMGENVRLMKFQPSEELLEALTGEKEM